MSKHNQFKMFLKIKDAKPMSECVGFVVYVGVCRCVCSLELILTFIDIDAMFRKSMRVTWMHFGVFNTYHSIILQYYDIEIFMFSIFCQQNFRPVGYMYEFENNVTIDKIWMRNGVMPLRYDMRAKILLHMT